MTHKYMEQFAFVANRDTRQQLQPLLASHAKHLAPEYVEFLCDTDGGQFDATIWCRCLEVPDNAADGRVLLSDFFGSVELCDQWSRALRPDFWEGALYLIADAPGGDMFALKPGDNSIFFWDHETGSTFRVASSFEDFQHRLELGDDSITPGDDDDCEIELDPELLRDLDKYR